MNYIIFDIMNPLFLTIPYSRTSLTLKTGSLLGLFSSPCLGPLIQLGLSLQSHYSTSPLAHQVCILVELLHSQILEDLELGFIFFVYSSESNNSRSLLVYKSSKTSLVLHNHEGDLHLPAQGREPEDEFDRVDVARNKDERRLLLLNKGSHVL